MWYNSVIQGCETVEDLGIIFYEKWTLLHWFYQLNGIKTSRYYPEILDFSVYSFKILYFSLVRSVLLCSRWNKLPTLNKLKESGEFFLRIRAFKMGFNKVEYTYGTILSYLNLHTSEVHALIIATDQFL